jgi:hypothetical protein
MLHSQYFSRPQLAKVLTNDTQAEGSSYSLQFHTDSMQTLHAWNAKHGMHFETACKKVFGNDVIYFTTVLELITTP